METKIINCHTHTFNRSAVPANFIPDWLKPLGWLLESKKTAKFFYETFSKLKKNETATLIKKYHNFLTVGDLKSQLEIFKMLQSFYPEDTRFCVLPMDMEFMEAGKVKQCYIEQLDELAAIKQDPAYTDLIEPFVFVHPERRDILEIVKFYIEEKQFAGIKLYPPLGYYPFDERLKKIYAYCQSNKIPVTTHCARGGVFYKGHIKPEMYVHPKTGKKLKPERNKFFTDVFTDPDNYKYVLDEFPLLKINLAHYGGYDEWEKYLTFSVDDDQKTWYEKVEDMIRSYTNVYTDISYTMFRPDLLNLLRLRLRDERLRDKILFGSDFYMTEIETSERQFLTNVQSYLGEADFRQIAETNPRNFLYK